MNRIVTTLTMMLLAGPAMAHVGHFGEFAGHDHWVAGAALGAAVAVSIWGALKGKKKLETSDEEIAEEGEEEAA